MSLIIIAAIADNNIIGDGNKLPWYLPEDLQRFKKLTSGHTVVMGRRTYESIVDRLKKPLPNRRNVVITSKRDYSVPKGVEVFASIDSFLAKFNWKKQNVYIIGGATIYKQMLPLVDILEITHVHDKPSGDVYFPEVDWSKWKEIKREDYEGFSFVTYKRVN